MFIRRLRETLGTAKKVKTQTIKASWISGYLRDIIWQNKYTFMENVLDTRPLGSTRYTRPIITFLIEASGGPLRKAKMSTLIGCSLRDHLRIYDSRIL